MRLESDLDTRQNAYMAEFQTRDTVQDWLDRLVTALRRRAGEHLAEAEQKAGVKPGYLRKAQSASSNIVLRKFLLICKAADIEPGEIFAEVFPKTDYDPDFGLAIPKGPLPWIVKKTRLCLQEAPSFPTVGESWLIWLEEQRYNDPRRVRRIAEHAVGAVLQEQIPRLLGVWASSSRALAHYSDASSALREALRLARSNNDPTTEADLLRRGASLVVSASADYSTALKVAGQAASLCARIGDLDKLGRVLVSQGIFLYYLERFSDSESAFKSALMFLDETSFHDRVAVLQVLGLISHARRQPNEALRFIARALPIASTKYQIGKLHWLEGCLARRFLDSG